MNSPGFKPGERNKTPLFPPPLAARRAASGVEGGFLILGLMKIKKITW
jgi:hypothetical protein